MGITKKAVLASLISTMMALAFLLGLVPANQASDVIATSGAKVRIDMVDLLNAVLNLEPSAVAAGGAAVGATALCANLVRLPGYRHHAEGLLSDWMPPPKRLPLSECRVFPSLPEISA